MKKFWLVALVILVGAAPARAEWLASGDLVNPLAGTVCLETVPQPFLTSVAFKITVTSSAIVNLDLQWRNATNTATIKNIPFRLAARSPLDWGTQGFSFNLDSNERLRLVILSDVVGNVSCNMFQ